MSGCPNAKSHQARSVSGEGNLMEMKKYGFVKKENPSAERAAGEVGGGPMDL